MYIKVKNKKIEIKELKTWKDRFKSLKFVLEPIDYGIKLPNKRWINTYFFCQRVDVCITNQDNIILELRSRIKSEKRRFLWKKYNIYYLPLKTVENLTVGEKLIEKKEDH